MKSEVTAGIWIGLGISAAAFVLCILSAKLAGHPAQKSLQNKQGSNQLEALKALADWSKWVVSLQTVLIGGLVLTLLEDEVESTHGDVRLLIAAVVCFLVSITAATCLLGAVPPAIEQIPIAVEEHCDMYSFRFFVIPIRHLAGVQHLCFLAGIVLGLAGFVSSSSEG